MALNSFWKWLSAIFSKVTYYYIIQFTNAHLLIAASTSLTGAAAKGGNWQLEVTTGKAVTALAFEDATLESYPAILNFTDSGQSLGSSYSDGVSLADVDGDGDGDAFVANSVRRPNKVWLNNVLW